MKKTKGSMNVQKEEWKKDDPSILLERLSLCKKKK